MRKPAMVIMVIALFASNCGHESPPTFDPRFQDVRERVIGLITDGKIASMSIAVAKDGRVIWEEAFGWADIENEVKATPHTKYRLGSISKTITATGLMILVEKEHIDLDRPIIEYLPEIELRSFVGAESDVTVRHLLNHRSGMPSYCWGYDDDDPEGHRGILETVRAYGIITVPPGVASIYCNLGYELMGYLISETSGLTYSRFIDEYVFLPLGMTEAEVHERGKVIHQAAVCYTPEFTPIPAHSASYPGASDGYCSAHDLIRFAMFHLKHNLDGQRAILSDDAIDHMQEAYPPSNTSFGIGWAFDINELGYRSVHHGGEGPGVDNFMRLIPSEDIAVVILCNTECGDNLREIQEEICTALIPELAAIERDKPSSDSGEQQVPEGFLGSWDGKIITYDHEIGVGLRVTQTDGVWVSLSEAPQSEVDLGVATDWFLMGEFPGTIPTPGAGRYPERVRLALVRQGDRLTGQATVVGRKEERQGHYELSSWIELRRQ
jgi:CubicO group peptidase (beta-lactamase class C family)